jgi:hypothetical protein
MACPELRPVQSMSLWSTPLRKCRKQAAKRKPSTFKDYCAAHGRSTRCESTGIVLDERRGGFKLAGSYEGVKLFERCPACEGTGLEGRLSYMGKAGLDGQEL